MKKRTISRLLIFSFAVMLAAAVLTALFAAFRPSGEKADGAAAELLADSSEKIVFVSASGTDYKLYFSSDSRDSDRLLANDISDVIRELYNVRLRANVDIMDKASAKEILIGDTNRSESKTLLKKIQNSVDDPSDLAWGYAVINGKLLYTANSDEAFAKGSDEFIKYLADNDFTVPNDLLVLGYMSREDYDKEIEEEEAAQREEIVKELIEVNSKFTQKDFGGEPRLMFTGASPYNPPAVYPNAGSHPRIFITEDKIDDVLEILSDPKFSTLAKTFWREADTECDGVFPIEADDLAVRSGANWHGTGCGCATCKEFGGPYWHRYDVDIISIIQNKAFAYLLTGNEIYGYEAIIGAKNMITTLVYSTSLHTDMYHGPSHIMIAVAKIYDWCYDLMSEDDKNQIIAGVSNLLAPYMEIKFPPSNMSPVAGHGTGPQLLRDYFMVSWAFYDEIPNWWEFVGGRYYQEYVPVMREIFTNGWVSQGTATYGPSKLSDAMISAYLIYLSTGQFPYVKEDIKETSYFILSHVQPNNKYFQTGDGPRNVVGGTLYYLHLFDVAAITKDPVATAHLYEITNNMSSAVRPDWTYDCPAAKVLAYLAYLPEPYEGDYHEAVETVQYFAEPAGNMTARSSWSSDAAAVMMKIGTRTLANHDILDHGTFQIYYKGLLAGTSGAYKKYGSSIHRNYLQATVGHNGILVFNPAFADDEAVWDCTKAHKHDPTTCAISKENASRYFYSGGQRLRTITGETKLDDWLKSEYDTGVMTGRDRGYNPDGTSEYGYIAGDITKAYDKETVSYLERRMLSVFTGNPDYPMLFFTFDTVESVDASFAKYSLIHTTKAPVIDEDNMSADIREGDGRLFIQSLYGAEKIEAIGGEGKAYWINGYYNKSGKYIEGKNCVDTYSPTDNADKFWGRVQLTADNKKQVQMLTAMFVTDSSNTETPEFKKFKNSSVFGAEFEGIYTVFTSSREKQAEDFSFRTSGKGLSRYYISGLADGLWSVTVDGIPVAVLGVDPEEGFASFIAPSGSITLTPCEISAASVFSEEESAPIYEAEASVESASAEAPLFSGSINTAVAALDNKKVFTVPKKSIFTPLK